MSSRRATATVAMLRPRRAVICARGATSQPAVAGMRCTASTAAHRISVEPCLTGGLLAKAGLALSGSQWRDKLAKIEAGWVHRHHYQPAGSNIPRELEAFAKAFRG